MKNTLDLSKLTDEQRERLEKALAPQRNTIVSLRFCKGDVELWHAAAESTEETFTGWIERHLNQAAKKGKGA